MSSGPSGTPSATAHVMYDASTTLTDEKAATIGPFLGDIGAHWFEEPFPVWHAERYRRLPSAAGVPLTGFETAPGAPGSIDWARRRMCSTSSKSTPTGRPG